MVVHHRIKESIRAIVKDYSNLIGNFWTTSLSEKLLKTEYFHNLQCYIEEVYNASDFIYPKLKSDIFRCLKLVRPSNVKVVIFGNEPEANVYSNGLAFGSHTSISKNTQHLPDVIKTIKNCLDPANSKLIEEFDTTLESWAEQGVLLLNTSLISERGNEMKHEIVFRNFIREIIKEIVEVNVDVVFVFTSEKQEQTFKKYIDMDFHHILVFPKGITEHCSIFDDINIVLEETCGTSKVINW